MKYRSVVAPRPGGLSVLPVVENDLQPAGDVQIRVLAAAVCAPDITSRDGKSPFTSKLPFTPGYGVIFLIVKVSNSVV